MDVKVIGGGKETILHYDDMEALSIWYGYSDFSYYYNLLDKAGVITKTETGRYQWTSSKSSLVQFFKHISDKPKKNMEWQPLEDVFNYKRGTLRRLASTNGNPDKKMSPNKKSKDFEEIVDIILGNEEARIINGIEWRRTNS